jgi:hypothetical protein
VMSRLLHKSASSSAFGDETVVVEKKRPNSVAHRFPM